MQKARLIQKTDEICIGTTYEEAPAITAKLIALDVNFSSSRFRVGALQKVLINLQQGNSSSDKENALDALRKEGILETVAEREERLWDIIDDMGSSSVPKESQRSIDDLELPTRLYGALQEAKITTIDRLTQMTENELLKTKNIGWRSVKTLKKLLAEISLTLRQ